LAKTLSKRYSQTICRRNACESAADASIVPVKCQGLHEPSFWPSEMMFCNFFIICTTHLSCQFCLKWVQGHCSWMANWQPPSAASAV